MTTETTPIGAGESSPAPDGWAIHVGQTYALRHSRFGRAVVTVTGIPDETWIDVEVVSGVMRGMGGGAVWGPGDSERFRREHCAFTPNARGDSLPPQEKTNGQ